MNDEIGRLVGGVWLPATETHLAHEMEHGKRRQLVDGKLTYQKHKLDAAVSLCKDHRRVALDIGGHVGLWSMWLVKLFGHVHAFEPVPLHAELFRRNVTSSNFTLHECALGEKDELISLEVPDETTGNAHIAIGRRHPGTRHVDHPDQHRVWADRPMKRLDQFDIQDVDFIKIDVEGFERAVIAGGEKLIRRCKPVIVVEQKGNDSAYGDARNAAVKLLQSWGMKIAKDISGDFIMRWDGCGCGDRREMIAAVARRVAG